MSNRSRSFSTPSKSLKRHEPRSVSRDHRAPHITLKPHGIYVSLLLERLIPGGSKEILVYKSAKHQIPISRLESHELTLEMKTWLRNSAGFTASQLIRICRYDNWRWHAECSRRSDYSKHIAEYTQDRSLLEFKADLAASIEHLMDEVTLVQSDLAQTVYLTPTVTEVPLIAGTLAHLITLRGDTLTDHKTVLVRHNSFYNESKQLSGFTYIPRSLFNVSQLRSQSTTGVCDYTKRRKEELGPTRDEHVDLIRLRWNERTPHSNINRNALVSSFSLDTINDVVPERDKRSNTRHLSARLSSCWTLLRNYVKISPLVDSGTTRRNISSSSSSIRVDVRLNSLSRSPRKWNSSSSLYNKSSAFHH